MVRPSRTYCRFASRPALPFRQVGEGALRLVTSGDSDGRVAAGLAAGAVSMADALPEVRGVRPSGPA